MREARAIRKAIVAMQTSDVQSHTQQTLGLAKGSNTTENRSSRTLRKPAKINGSKNCETYLRHASSDIRTGETSSTTRAGEIHNYVIAREIPVH